MVENTIRDICTTLHEIVINHESVVECITGERDLLRKELQDVRISWGRAESAFARKSDECAALKLKLKLRKTLKARGAKK